MPAFIHNRAEHILAKNPSMKKSTAFAIATQQSHALGKSPKGYGTPEGKAEAKKKYDEPRKEYRQTANPGSLTSPKMEKKGWKDELPGGLSDNKTPADFSPDALTKGRKAESEHTKSKHLQTEISMDHLSEDPKYYEKLQKMEKSSAVLNQVIVSAFSDEMSQILKEAGLKDVLLHEIPGTKPWLIGNPALSGAAKPAASAVNTAKAVIRPRLKPGQMTGGAWDVSRQAAQMGL
jgi:Protein of unknown function (DUF5661)